MIFLIEGEIRELLQLITVRKRRSYSDLLRQLGLHVGQDQLLCRLSKEGGMTQRQLSESLKCEPSTIANTVKSLENYGLIHRERDAMDGRVNRVYLTEKGRNIIEPVENIWMHEQNRLLEGLTEEELISLKKLLVKMASNVT